MTWRPASRISHAIIKCEITRGGSVHDCVSIKAANDEAVQNALMAKLRTVKVNPIKDGKLMTSYVFNVKLSK